MKSLPYVKRNQLRRSNHTYTARMRLNGAAGHCFIGMNVKLMSKDKGGGGVIDIHYILHILQITLQAHLNQSIS